MKRRSKVLVLIGSVFGFVCIGFLLQKMEHLPVASIGGEMIVDNPSWRNRDIAHEFDTGYLWVTPKTILYRENAAGNYRVIRQPVERGKNLLPEIIPNVTLSKRDRIVSLSPDEQTLCLMTKSQRRNWKYLLIPMDDKGGKKLTNI